MPEAFWDADKREVKSEAAFSELKKFSDERVAAEEARAKLPKSAGEYKVELPADYKLPDGMELDLKNPSWGALAEFAHKRGLSQADFAEGAKLWTEAQIHQTAAHQKAINDFKAAEEVKLGENSKARVEAVHRFFDANFGEAAPAMKASLANSEMVAGIEKMIALLQSSGVTSFNGSGRDDGRRLDGRPQNWEQMSPLDRRAWDLTNPQKTNGASR